MFGSVSRCFTEEGCHRVHHAAYVRAWPQAGRRSLQSAVRRGGGDAGTSRISLSSPGWRDARSNSFASTMPSGTRRRTVRRGRSTVQVEEVMRFRTRTTWPQAGQAASAARSATTYPTGPGPPPDVPRRGWRGPCGWRPVAGAQARIAADMTAAARRPQSGFGALGNQRPFELGDGAQHCSENMPCGVVVSIGSRRLRKCAPVASSCSMTARRWLTERARRSRGHLPVCSKLHAKRQSPKRVPNLA